MRDTIDGDAFKQMIISSAAAVELQKQQINELNVFPVPDGDTGTNMSLTIGNAASELKKQNPESIERAAEITAGALLRGARGNSGVILSLLFRGAARYLKGKKTADGFELATAFSEGVDTAYNAVMKPAEGTILTVSRVASNCAIEAAVENASAEYVLEKMIKAGYAALAKTVDQNPVLKKAGVIDAGGKGYLVILEGMLSSMKGIQIAAPDGEEPVQVKEKADFSEFHTEDIKFRYCTEFIVNRTTQKDPGSLNGFLDNLGDSVVVASDDELIKVHVHTNNPGKVIEEALSFGDLATVKIENMREQHTETLAKEKEEDASIRKIVPPEKKFGIVAVCAGEGLMRIFSDLGVDGIISGGQTMNPATEDILKEIDKTPAEIVYVLPNNKNIIMAAQQCVPMSDKKVVVLPTISVPQGISAILDMDENAEEEQNTATMTEAAKKVKTMQVTCASRDSEYDGQNIKEGDYMALENGRLFIVNRDLDALMKQVAGAFKEYDPEIVTVFYGEGITEGDADSVVSLLTDTCPDAKVSVLDGGQPIYLYIISAEK